MLQSAEENFLKLGLELPPLPRPSSVYKPFLRVDNLIYVSGCGPVLEEEILIKGKVGYDINADAQRLQRNKPV